MKYPLFCLQHLTPLSRGNLSMLIFVFIFNTYLQICLSFCGVFLQSFVVTVVFSIKVTLILFSKLPFTPACSRKGFFFFAHTDLPYHISVSHSTIVSCCIQFRLESRHLGSNHRSAIYRSLDLGQITYFLCASFHL